MNATTEIIDRVYLGLEEPFIAEMTAKAIEDLWGLDATQEDVDEIYALISDVGLSYAIARVISKNHTVIGWTTHGHNGEDVPVWIYPQSAAIGTIDNTDLPAIGQAGDLDALTEELYIEVNQIFDEDDWSIVESDVYGNLLLVVEDVQMPISKDIAVCNGKEHNLGSLVVYAPQTGKVYIPEKVVALIDRCEDKQNGKKDDDEEDDD